MSGSTKDRRKKDRKEARATKKRRKKEADGKEEIKFGSVQFYVLLIRRIKGVPPLFKAVGIFFFLGGALAILLGPPEQTSSGGGGPIPIIPNFIPYFEPVTVWMRSAVWGCWDLVYQPRTAWVIGGITVAGAILQSIINLVL